VFRTRDFGATWESLARGLPSGSVNVIREHARNTNLLFLGTEHAAYVSADAGANWVKLTAGLPTSLYDDIVIHPRDNDLILASHGNSLWILDDITPLVEWSDAIARAEATLFTIRPATIFNFRKNDSYRAEAEFIGQNRPFGALIHYHLSGAAASARITVANREGTVVRALEAPATAGLHRVMWDLRHESPPPGGGGRGGGGGDEEGGGPPGQPYALPLPHPLGARGPFVAPGTYQVTLEAGGARFTKEVVVKPDPLMPMLTQQDYEQRERFLVGILALQRRAAAAAERAPANTDPGRRLNALRGELNGLAGEFNGSAVRPGSLHSPGPDHRRRFTDLERSLTQLLAEIERTTSRR
jgi:hypothetical protein